MEGDLKNLSLSIRKVVKAPKAKTPDSFLDITETIDELLSSSQTDYLSLSFSPVVKECLQSLIDILHNAASSSFKIPSNVMFKILSLLTNLTASEACLVYLMSQYHTVPTLLLPVLKDANLIQNLKLIVALTMQSSNEPIIHVREIEPVLKMCISNVLSSDGDLLSLSLDVLVNVCTNSIPVQAWARSHAQYDAFQKKLVALLSHKSVGVIVASLHLLASLCLKEKLGGKIFRASNLQQTVQLILSVVCTSHDCSAIRNAVSLTKLLLASSEHFHQALMSCSQLSVSLTKLLKRLTEVNANNATKILEMLCILSDFQDIASHIAGLLFTTNSSVGGIVAELLGETDLVFTHAVVQGLKLLTVLVQTEACHQLLTQSSTALTPTPLLSAVSINLGCHLLCSEGEESVKLVVRKVNTALSLLHNIAEATLILLGKYINSAHLIELIKNQFKYNALLNGLGETCDWSGIGVSIAVSSLHLLLLLKEQSMLKEYLQNPKALLAVANGIKSGNQCVVQHALHVLNHMLTMNLHTVQSFSEALVNEHPPHYNPSSSPSYTSAVPTSSHEYRHMKDINNMPGSRGVAPGSVGVVPGNGNVDSASLDKLIEKFQSGCELRDVRVSEIMNMYECKLKALVSKESHVQDLLEAKTLALAQADRLLSQYREKISDSDMELERTRAIMRDTEQECERLHDQEIVYQRNQLELEAIVDQLKSEKAQLMTVAEEHQLLTKSYQEQSLRLEEAERSVHKLQNVKSELEQKIIQLQTSICALQQTVTSKTNEIDQLTGKLRHCCTSLEESEAKCTKLNGIIGEKDSQLSSLVNIRENLESKILDLSKALTNSQDKNRNLLQQIKALESEKKNLQEQLCQAESSIRMLEKEKDSLTKEVNLFSAVKDLISKGKA